VVEYGKLIMRHRFLEHGNRLTCAALEKHMMDIYYEHRTAILSIPAPSKSTEDYR
jgi:hypothetical protein